jgi:hypothetical protein
MLMPETSMHEDDLLASRKHKIRLAGEIGPLVGELDALRNEQVKNPALCN